MVKLTEISSTPLEALQQETSESSSTPTSGKRKASPSGDQPEALKRRTAPEDGTGPRKPDKSAVIGVMGGMGPAAANQFGHLLIDLKTGAKKDQEHARVLLDQATNIPDRTAAILRGGENPVPNMVASLKRLDAGGADIVAITCNTAHHFHPDMLEAIENLGLKLNPLHIVDATMKELDIQKPGAQRIGLLATTGTLDSRIYEDRSKQTGHDKQWLYPSDVTQQNCVMDGIYKGVKAGNVELGRDLLLKAATELKKKGADAILLACTEIPLVLTTGDLLDGHGHAMPLIDTLAALAKEALARADTTLGRAVTSCGSFDIREACPSSFLEGANAMIYGTEDRPRRIGVMGGMGPAAAMQFSDYVVKFNDSATKDQDHVLLILDQATDIPDRTSAILGGGGTPVPAMVDSLHRLAAAGADDIVMTCNTAHYFYPQVKQAIDEAKLDMGVIHIVEATMKLLDEQAPGARNIGLLATSGTVDTKVYQQNEAAKGRHWHLPDADSQKDVMSGIYEGVKSGDIDKGTRLLRKAAQTLADKGADAILLACTEIPLVLATGDIKRKDGTVVPLIDTLEAQAREAIRRAKLPVPCTPAVLKDAARLLCAPEAPAAPEASSSVTAPRASPSASPSSSRAASADDRKTKPHLAGA